MPVFSPQTLPPVFYFSPLIRGNQHQQNHNAGNADRNAQNHLAEHHAQAHAHAQQQRTDDTLFHHKLFLNAFAYGI